MATPTTERRSTRDRKQTQFFVSVGSHKRKRSPDSDGEDQDDDDEQAEEEEPSEEDEPEEDDDEPEFNAPRTARAKRAPRPQDNTKATPAKKPRFAPKVARGRKPKATLGINPAKDAYIADDNVLFSTDALINPAAALQSTVQDLLDSYESTPEPALADLVNCIFRSCGCNSSVNSDEAVDGDGVVEFLGDLVEEMKAQENQGYPLTSKTVHFKKFRKSLSEFFDRLISSSAETEVLFESDLMQNLQTWIIAMSSATLRSFRHTATVIALEIESALASVAATIEKEAETVGRQREGERKRRKTGNKSDEREKALSAKAAEIKAKKTKINEYLKEFFDGVFIHRYRDADAGIRADCVREMGVWLKRHPAHFLEGNYLRYVGWVLSDSNANVRLEAVKSLQALYSKSDYMITLQHFTERFKPRLIKMATRDIELAVRVATIDVLVVVDANGLLDEDQREELCLLVFDEEFKVRKAVGGFVHGVWEEAVTQRLVGRSRANKEQDQERAGAKALALLLVAWERSLSGMTPLQDDDDTQDTSAQQANQPNKEIAVLGNSKKSRVTLAVEALWNEVPIIQDWELLLNHLLLDHSASAPDEAAPVSKLRKSKKGGPVATPRKGKAKGADPDAEGQEVVDEAWRLEEVEETVLFEVFLASLQKSLSDAAAKKGSDEDAVQAHMTRALIKALPKLFAKNQTVPTRIIHILTIPTLMNLEVYIEMRMVTAYETLWDDVCKQFLTQTSPVVLSTVISTIRHLVSATTLGNTNSTKIVELEDELSTALREAIANKEDIEAASFSEDEITSLTAIVSRISMLFRYRDLSGWMEEDEGGKQSTAWEIISAFAERARLGRKEEEFLTENAIRVMTTHIFWRLQSLSRQDGQSTEYQSACDVLTEQRDLLVEKLSEYVTGTQSSVSDVVKHAAFESLINLHILFPRNNPIPRPAPLEALKLSMSDQLQLQCAEFVQAEAEKFSDELRELEEAEAAAEDDDTVRGDSDSNDDGTLQPRKKKKLVKTNAAPNGPTFEQLVESRRHLETEHHFLSTMFALTRAFQTGAMDLSHAPVLLAYYGRLGETVDQTVKPVMELLKEEGMFQGNGELVVRVISESIRQSFTMFVDGIVDSEENTVMLAKTLSSALVIRGAHLSINRRLDGHHIVEIHTSFITWILKRIAGYDKSGNKKKKNDSIVFFRVLHPLLATIESRDASKIKAHMDKILKEVNIEVPPAAKPWDAQRLYEKRLLTVMAKDKDIVAKSTKGAKASKKSGAKSADAIESDEEDGDEAPAPRAKAKQSLPLRPRSTRTTRGQPAREVSSSESENDEEALDTQAEAPPPSTPRPKPKPKPVSKSVSKPTEPRAPPSPSSSEAEADPEPEPETDRESVAPDPPSSMRSARGTKRRRPDSDSDEGSPSRQLQGGPSDSEQEPLTTLLERKQHDKPSSQASHISLADFKSNRKRARR